MMTAATAIALTGFGILAGKMAQRHRADKKMARSARQRSCTELKYVHEVLAGLTDVVYAHDEGINAKFPPESLGYRLLEPGDLQLSTDADRSVVANGKDRRAGRLMIFERIDDLGSNRGYGLLRMENNNESGEVQYKRVPLPKFVVAIRGTIVTDWNDMSANILTAIELVCKKKWVVVGMLLDIVGKVGSDDVWVTGHSLGALLGLVATLQLAHEKHIVLNTHVFNPPQVSLDVLAKKLLIGTVNGVASGAGKIPLVGGSLRRAVRFAGFSADYVLEKTARGVGNVLAPSVHRRAAERQGILREIGVCPHVYVNPKDSICNEYIPHFKHGSPGLSTTVPFMKMLRRIASLVLPVDSESNCDSCHLIPQAYLHINHWAKGPLQAHKLKQWYLYDPVSLTSERAG